MREFCISMLVLCVGTAVQAGQLGGRVVDAGGQPVAWIFLDLYDADGEYFDYSYTDANGDYGFSDLGDGTYFVRTDALGRHVDEWYDDVAGAAEGLIHDPIGAGATPVEVPLFGAADGIDFELAAAAVITGRVVRAGIGQVPLTNVYVDACLPDGARVRSGITGTTGMYAIEGLPAGSYAVRTDAGRRGVDTWQDGTVAFNSVGPAAAGVPLLTLAAGQTLDNVDFALAEPGLVGGRLQRGDGAPVAGVYVDLFDIAGTHLEFTRSGADGGYQLVGLPAGQYLLGTDSLGSYVDLWYDQRLMVNPGDPVADLADPVALGAAESLTNFWFTLDRGAAVSGRVIDDTGAGIADAFVDAFLDGIYFDFAVTGADGGYTLPALPDGEYYLKADTGGRFRNEWYPDAPVYDVEDPVGDGAGTVAVTNGASVTNILFELVAGASVAGTVSAQAGGAIAECYVDLHQADGRRLFYTRTNSNGVYRVGGLPAGTYYLATDTSGAYVDEWYPDQVLMTRTNPVADAAGALVLGEGTSLTNLHLVLREGGSISGTVTGPDGLGLAGCYLDVYRGTNYHGWTWTDSNGVYRVETLPAGTYYLRTDACEEVVNEWYGGVYIFHLGAPEADGASPVVLADDQHVGQIDFALGWGADLEGSVRTIPGSPLAGIFVDAYDFAGRYYDFAVTDATGAFHLEMLPPGTWYVGTDTFGAYLDRWFRDAVREFYNDPIADGATPLSLADGTVMIGVDLRLGLPPEALVVLGAAPAAGGGALLEWPGEADQAYQVQRNQDLRGGVWTNAPAGTADLEQSLKPAGPAGVRQYLDPAPPPAGPAAYRITNP